MREDGFSLLEVMVSIAIFSLVIGLGYGVKLSLEKLHYENKILYRVVEHVQLLNNDWRNSVDITDTVINIEQSIVQQKVERSYLTPNIERAYIQLSWQIGKKSFVYEWQTDRFIP